MIRKVHVAYRFFVHIVALAYYLPAVLINFLCNFWFLVLEFRFLPLARRALDRRRMTRICSHL